INGGSLDFGFVSLADLLPYAFRVKSFQVAGPSWIRESRWNIQAKLPEGASQDQVPEMMQTLLAERFELSIHHEKREQPVYELVAGKGPTKLEPSEAGTDANSGCASLPGAFPVLPFPRTTTRRRKRRPPFLDRPVVDATGLKGTYKFTLDLPM